MIKLYSDSHKLDSSGIEKLNGVGSTFKPHTHNFYEFFLVTKGRALHYVNGVSHIVERGTLVLIRPDDCHSYDYYRSDDFEFYNRGFTAEDFKCCCAIYKDEIDLLLDRPLPKHIKTDEETLRFLENKFSAYNKITDPKTKKYALYMLIEVVLYYMLATPEYEQSKLPAQWFTDLLGKMNEQENYIEGLPRLLEICNYSQEHINRAFKRYLNTTPTRYINELRLRYAAELLKSSDKSIIEISADCGFNNLSHFYTEFRRLYGCSPKKIK